MLYLLCGAVVFLVIIKLMGWDKSGDSSWVGGDYSDGVWDTFGDD